jgi:hypothetical protein
MEFLFNDDQPVDLGLIIFRQPIFIGFNAAWPMMSLQKPCSLVKNRMSFGYTPVYSGQFHLFLLQLYQKFDSFPFFICYFPQV